MERHQSYPKTGGQTTRKDIRVTPRQEAKPPGKTSELSQDRRQNHQERHQSYPRTGDVRELRHLCGIFWLGWFMDVGRSEGVAASMWHILVRLVYGCREIWGSCAIYVGIPSRILANEWELPHLFPKKAAWCWEKNMGGNQRRRLQKICHV